MTHTEHTDRNDDDLQPRDQRPVATIEQVNVFSATQELLDLLRSEDAPVITFTEADPHEVFNEFSEYVLRGPSDHARISSRVIKNLNQLATDLGISDDDRVSTLSRALGSVVSPEHWQLSYEDWSMILGELDAAGLPVTEILTKTVKDSEIDSKYRGLAAVSLIDRKINVEDLVCPKPDEKLEGLVASCRRACSDMPPEVTAELELYLTAITSISFVQVDCRLPSLVMFDFFDRYHEQMDSDQVQDFADGLIQIGKLSHGMQRSAAQNLGDAAAKVLAVEMVNSVKDMLEDGEKRFESSDLWVAELYLSDLYKNTPDTIKTLLSSSEKAHNESFAKIIENYELAREEIANLALTEELSDINVELLGRALSERTTDEYLFEILSANPELEAIVLIAMNELFVEPIAMPRMGERSWHSARGGVSDRELPIAHKLLEEAKKGEGDACGRVARAMLPTQLRVRVINRFCEDAVKSGDTELANRVKNHRQELQEALQTNEDYRIRWGSQYLDYLMLGDLLGEELDLDREVELACNSEDYRKSIVVAYDTVCAPEHCYSQIESLLHRVAESDVAAEVVVGRNGDYFRYTSLFAHSLDRDCSFRDLASTLISTDQIEETRLGVCANLLCHYYRESTFLPMMADLFYIPDSLPIALGGVEVPRESLSEVIYEISEDDMFSIKRRRGGECVVDIAPTDPETKAQEEDFKKRVLDKLFPGVTVQSESDKTDEAATVFRLVGEQLEKSRTGVATILDRDNTTLVNRVYFDREEGVISIHDGDPLTVASVLKEESPSAARIEATFDPDTLDLLEANILIPKESIARSLFTDERTKFLDKLADLGYPTLSQ